MAKSDNKSLIGVLLIVIVGLIYYVYNKKRLDYQFNKTLTNEATDATKQYYQAGIQDIKDIWNGKKEYFG